MGTKLLLTTGWVLVSTGMFQVNLKVFNFFYIIFFGSTLSAQRLSALFPLCNCSVSKLNFKSFAGHMWLKLLFDKNGYY